MGIDGIRARVGSALLLVGTLIASGTARAEPAADTATTSRADIQEQIELAQARHSHAKGRVITGSIAIGIGFVATVISSAEDPENQYENEEVKIDWVPLLVGAALGAPLLATGITDMASSRRDLRRLEQEKRRRMALSLTPVPGGAGATFEMSF